MTYRILFPLVLLSLLPIAVADGLLSLDSSNGFNKLRDCALGCYNGGIRDGYMVTDQLSCRKPGVVYIPPDNDCFCRPDLQETAVRYLSTCVYTSCSQNELDVSSATQVYKDYCTSAGYTAAAPKSTPAQTTAGGEIVGTTPSDSGSIPVVNTGTPDSNETAGDNKFRPGIGAMFGIGGGVLGAIVAAIGLCACASGCL
ncbi:hypothetical protein B0T21DRAFT_70980 [Apiosordaria backusii]|uniref:Extracellular membrane protein CFEM domain-containing protein n=1 Tax=Apiosordaria backusii TaxID=314023 RepID=A0AA40AEJ6_9PEZI|nr:hypothetical protein B0T21DRAFT_70980 [Apiosordaria backusii]